jgi:hypothetical protein
MKQRLLITLIPVFLTGCAGLNSVLQSLPADAPLTEAEVADGLKEALITGSRKASSVLGTVDGYYGDELVKIMLPEEASVIIDNLSRLPGGEQLVEDVILGINRAAEDAAKEAAPIFINAIQQMTIGDAFQILNGADNAATEYLGRTSRTALYDLFRPKIGQSTEKDILGTVSAKDSWTTLTGKWNQVANSVAGKFAGLTPVHVELDDYLTNKALDGMFLKVEAEEKKIRTEISARVTPLLKKVFGSLDP